MHRVALTEGLQAKDITVTSRSTSLSPEVTQPIGRIFNNGQRPSKRNPDKDFVATKAQKQGTCVSLLLAVSDASTAHAKHNHGS